MFKNIILIVAFVAGLTLMSSGEEQVLDMDTTNNNTDMGICECGGFDSTVVVGDVRPILAQSYLNTTCDQNGLTTCTTFCKNLALMAGNKTTIAICKMINHAVSIKVSLHVRVCETAWVYSNLTSPVPFCCHEGKEIKCEETILQSSATTLVYGF